MYTSTNIQITTDSLFQSEGSAISQLNFDLQNGCWQGQWRRQGDLLAQHHLVAALWTTGGQGESAPVYKDNFSVKDLKYHFLDKHDTTFNWLPTVQLWKW